jgi:hypothetical protein
MMDAAAAAAMSDPERNPAFRRRWWDAATRAHVCVVTAGPDLDDNLAATGRELLEQWRRERARWLAA